jgi:N,N-dimethylformamidase beta subunit-like, C-terminal
LRTREGASVENDEQPRSAASAISRRRLLASGALVGFAAALAGCASRPAPTASRVTSTQGPSGAPARAPSAAPSPTASPDPTPAAPLVLPARDSAIQAENAQLGDRDWDSVRLSGQASAYLGAGSVGPGEPLHLRATGTGTVNVEWYRLGWYGGTGGRLLRVDKGVRLGGHPRHAIDPVTGLVEAGWPAALTMTAPAGVRSGMLLAVLRDPSGNALANAPIVLRPDPTSPHRAPVLFVSAACTWQAYNHWGGTDLYGNYGGVPIRATKNHRAAQVSFDRPYDLDGGAGYLRRWELQFIRWMERNGRDVEYIADLDLERFPDLVTGRRLVVMAGHLEYWSRPMRTSIEAAIASGINVAFLTGNEVYWQTRLEDGPTGRAGRITCYKSRTADPITATQPSLTTCRWREAPVNEPEAPLIGEMYGHVVKRVADWIVQGEGHWFYEGTGLRNGDALSNLVGQEYDSYFPDLANPGTVLLANSPVQAALNDPQDPGAYPSPSIHNATVYTDASGATVVAAGTFQWSWAIDDYGNRSYRGVATPVDTRVSRITRNVFDRLGDGPLAP